MIATFPGFVSIAGMFCVGVFLSGRNRYRPILEAFVYLFLTFCSLNAAINLEVDRDIYFMMYAMPAVISAAMTMVIFRGRPSVIVTAFVGLYMVHIVGTWLCLDMYKILMGIDFLDVLTWVQLGLLIYLAHQLRGQRKRSVNHHGRNHPTGA